MSPISYEWKSLTESKRRAKKGRGPTGDGNELMKLTKVCFGLAVRMKDEAKKMQKKKFLKEYLEPITIAVLIALFVRAFIAQAFKIPSCSMEPTLLVGDYLKFIYAI